MITNFPLKKNYNPGGLKSFLFVPISSILSFPAIKDGKTIAPIALINSASWLIGYATPYTLIFEEPAKDSPNGIYYEQKLSGFSPGGHVELLNQIQIMEGNEFVVLAEDSRNVTRLIGGYGYPLKFVTDFSTGSNRSDAKGFDFSFIGNSIFRAPVYIG